MIWGRWISLISHCPNSRRCNCDPAFMKSAFLAGVSAGETVVLDARLWGGPNLFALYAPSSDLHHTGARTTEAIKQRVKREYEGGCGKIAENGNEREEKQTGSESDYSLNVAARALCLSKSHFLFLEIISSLYHPLSAAARLWIQLDPVFKASK